MPENESKFFKLPYPSATGLVKNGAKNLEELAVAIDTLLHSAWIGAAQIKAEAVTGPKLGEGTVRQETGSPQGFLSMGYVEADGKLRNSATSTGDFTTSLVSTGLYAVTWDTEKANETYAIVVTPIGGTTELSWCIEYLGKTLIRIEFRKGSNLTDTPFTFIALATTTEEQEPF